MTVLKHGDTATRQAAFQALIQIGAPAARPLVAALQDDDTDVRQAAFWALIKIGSPAVDNLVAALHDEHTDIRQAAARALGKIADPRAVVPLIGAFKDPDWSVRRDAYQAIVKTGQAAIQPLIQALNHENEEIQWGAAGTLEALGWKPDQGEIGATYWIVKNEWGKCVDIGLPAVAPLITRLDHWDQNISKEAVGTLIRIGTPAVSPLIAALQHESPEIRKRAAFALGMIGDNRADQPLRALLSDKNKEVGKAASEAVSAIETGEVWRG
jgi:HEAT repeat protein